MDYIPGRNRRKFGGKTYTLEAIAYFRRWDAIEVAQELRGKGASARITKAPCKDESYRDFQTSPGLMWLVWVNWKNDA